MAGGLVAASPYFLLRQVLINTGSAASTSVNLIRRAVGLLPDMSPYTIDEAVDKLKRAALIAAHMLCEEEDEELEAEFEVVMEAAAGVVGFMDWFKKNENKKWRDHCNVPLKAHLAGSPSPKVKCQAMLHITSY